MGCHICGTPLFIQKMKLEVFVKDFGAEYISSRQNPRVIGYGKLSDKKYRDETGVFLAEGVKLAVEALTWADTAEILISQKALEADSAVLDIARMGAEKNIHLTVLSDSAFEKISTEKSPQGVIAVVRYLRKEETEDFVTWQSGKRLLMLDGIRDPGNMGTILRTAEALGVDGVILSSCVDPYHPKTVRAAMGTIYRMPLYSVNDGVSVVRQMKEGGRRVFAAALGDHTMKLGEFETKCDDCIIIGNEGHGVSEEIIAASTACLMIEMAGNTESLNASAAAACILWEYFRRK